MNLVQPAEHRGHRSVRWDDALSAAGANAIALSVADMDFKAPQAVTDAIAERAQSGNFCYTYLTETYYEAVTRWCQERYGWTVKPEQIIAAGRVVEVLPAILSAITTPGAAVIVPTPSYGPIPQAVAASNRVVREWPMRENDGTYTFDFESAEHVFKDAQALVLINPHNPTGRVWTKEELERIRDLARAHDVIVISDEVHADLINRGHVFTPYQSRADLSDKAISLLSPGKTFNLAGLEILNVVVGNPELRAQVSDAITNAGNHNPRFFAQVALETAYEFGQPWLDEVLDIIDQNITAVLERLETIPGVSAKAPQGTYLIWLDYRAHKFTEAQATEALHTVGLSLSAGSGFGAPGFFRLNAAVPTAQLMLALDRLETAFSGQ